MEQTDITLAIHIDDIALLESVFHAAAPSEEGTPQTHLMVVNPEHTFSFDAKERRTTLRSMVSVQFGLANPSAKPDANGGIAEFLHFGLTVGVVASMPLLGDAPSGPRHMAGTTPDDTTLRDMNMRRSMRVEAIKVAYAMASSKLVEASSMSPLGRIVLPAIDADALLDELVRSERPNA